MKQVGLRADVLASKRGGENGAQLVALGTLISSWGGRRGGKTARKQTAILTDEPGETVTREEETM